jgi:uncharacterized protein YraI
MPLTAEQHASIATAYEKAAADFLIPAERRNEFARKADWFRHLARLEAKRESTAQMPDPSMEDWLGKARAGVTIFGMKPVLASLWLTGAVLYLISTSTLLFTTAVNVFGGDDERKPISKQVDRLSLSHPTGPQVLSPKQAIPAYPQRQAAASLAAERPHAISPNQPSMEPPLATDAPAGPQQTAALPSTAEQATPQMASSPQAVDLLRLKSAASIRSGPSPSAKVIGTAAAGADLRVTAYQSGWVQFEDPSSGETGWVHSTFVEPSAGGEATAATKQVDDLPEVAPPKSKSIKAAKQGAKGVVVSKRPRPSGRSPKAYVELPSDEEFLPPRKRGRLGILEKRRMLREGLMSPGFLPPQ